MLQNRQVPGHTMYDRREYSSTHSPSLHRWESVVRITTRSKTFLRYIFKYPPQDYKKAGNVRIYITSRWVRVTIVAAEKQQVLHIMTVCVCSLGYPVCNAYAPYYLWHVRLYNIFSSLSYKWHDFRNKKKVLLNIKCVFWFSLRLLSETFLILTRNEQDMIRHVYWATHKVPVILVRF